MINTNDIIARLRNGESVETIADEMAKALNEAETTFRDEENARRAAELEKNKKEAMLNSIANDLISCIEEYIEVAFPNLYDTLFAEGEPLDTKTVREMLDSTLSVAGDLGTLTQMFKTAPIEKINIQTTDKEVNDLIKDMMNILQRGNNARTQPKTTKTAPRDPIADFLKRYGL